jgi:hypothetical protein
MKIDVDKYGNFVIGESESPITFSSNTGEILSVVMNDTGFEVWYKEDKHTLYKRYQIGSDGITEIIKKLHP